MRADLWWHVTGAMLAGSGAMLCAKSAFLMTLLASTPVACGGSTTTDRPETPASPDQASARFFITQCANAESDAGTAPEQVFVELGVFEVSPATSRSWGSDAPSIERLLATEEARLVKSLHILATTGIPAEISVSVTEKPKPAETLRVLPSFPSPSQLDLAFSFGGTEGKRLTRSEQPEVIRLREEEEGRARVGVLIAHYIWSPSDLRRVYECKKQLAADAKRR